MKYLKIIFLTGTFTVLHFFLYGQNEKFSTFQKNLIITQNYKDIIYDSESHDLNFLKINSASSLKTQHYRINNCSTHFPEKLYLNYKAESSKHFFFGLTGGIGFSTGRYIYKSIAAPPALSIRIGAIAGISMDWRASDHFSFQFNALYKEKGDRIKMNEWIKVINENDEEQTEGGTVTAEGFQYTKISYIEASMLPVLVIGDVFEIGVGGFIGYGLNGKKVNDFTIKYDFPEFPIDDESFNNEVPINFILIAPSSIEKNKIYMNRIDYGGYGHLGVRINPIKISFSLSYSMKQLEPDSKLSSLFFEDIDHTYNLTAGLTLSWFF